MRIFYAASPSADARFSPGSTIWRDNLYRSLAEMGNDVVEFEYDMVETFGNLDERDPRMKAFIDVNRPRLSRELVRQVKAAHALKPVDLFFSYFYDVCVLPEAIDEIRALGIKTVNWYCNGSYQLDLVRKISPHYDWCLVPEKFRMKDYVAMGARPVYCQEAANPATYRPYGLPVEYDVTFVGQAYGDRPAYIRHLIGQGVDVRVWGRGWKDYAQRTPVEYLARALHVAGSLATQDGRNSLWRRFRPASCEDAASGLGPVTGGRVLPAPAVGGMLSDTEMVKMFSRSKINLGFSTCGSTHLSGERVVQVRLRDFEVPMSGGFYMVEYMEELEEFFEIGREVVCYTGREDLAEKVRYYLSHDAEREGIRKAGRERCLRDHSWRKRFEDAFKEMGLA